MLKTGLYFSCCKIDLLALVVHVRAIVWFSSDFIQIKVMQLFTLVSPVNLWISQNNQNNA